MYNGDVVVGYSLEGYPWAKAAENGRVGQANVNGQPNASSSDVVSTAVGSMLLNNVHPANTVSTATTSALRVDAQDEGSGTVVLVRPHNITTPQHPTDSPELFICHRQHPSTDDCLFIAWQVVVRGDQTWL